MEKPQDEGPPPVWATVVVSFLLIALLGGGVYWGISFFGGKGAPDVEKLTEKNDIEGLISALAYDGEGAGEIVADAKNALITIGGPAVDPLVDARGDDDPTICSRAVSILGEIGDISAEDAMFSYAKERCETDSNYEGSRLV